MIATASIFNAAESERRKLSAHEMLAARRELYVLRGRRALLRRMLDAGEACADDVRAAVELPGDIDPKCFGVVPGALALAGIIAEADYVKSQRPEAHRRPIQRWRLADRAAALAWLDAHPDRPDSDESDAGEPGQLFD